LWKVVAERRKRMDFLVVLVFVAKVGDTFDNYSLSFVFGGKIIGSFILLHG